jgi:ParB-like chromosome segregation protein Spo0J
MPPLKITYKSPTQLKPRARNPRTHTKKQIQQIAASIKEFGFISPVLTDGADGIIAGHGRIEAAKLIGMSDVPTVHVDHLTPAQIRAYVIADNKLCTPLARWYGPLGAFPGVIPNLPRPRNASPRTGLFISGLF